MASPFNHLPCSRLLLPALSLSRYLITNWKVNNEKFASAAWQLLKVGGLLSSFKNFRYMYVQMRKQLFDQPLPSLPYLCHVLPARHSANRNNYMSTFFRCSAAHLYNCPLPSLPSSLKSNLPRMCRSQLSGSAGTYRGTSLIWIHSIYHRYYHLNCVLGGWQEIHK